MTSEFEFTQSSIEQRTGFKLAVVFPHWETDAAGILSFHDELERLGKDFGWENTFGTLFVEEDKLALGIFIKHKNVIEARVIEHELPVGNDRRIEPGPEITLTDF